MTKQQAAFIILVNAFVSLVISLTVAFIFRSLPSASPPATVAQGSGAVTAAPSEPRATPTPTIHKVQSGETLSGIAAKFGVSVDDLMKANGLSNADLLQIGQPLLIPVNGLLDITPTFTSVPTPTETPLPFEPPTPLPAGYTPPAEPAATPAPTATPLSAAALPVAVRISELVSAGEYDNEVLVIINHGRPVRLDGWTLGGQDGPQYTFPNLFLGAGGGVRVHTAAGQDTPTDLYWGQQSAAWGKAGTVVALRDGAGRVMDSYTLQ